jgi:hypothetical protein
MEQRVYHGTLSPEDMADFLVQRYDPQPDVQAQKVGQGDSLLVQIGYGDATEKMRHAVTVAIARTTDGEPGVVVTMGQRQWITPEEVKHAAFWGLLALLVTPWVLFALLWPLSDVLSSSSLPGDIWNAIDVFAGTHSVSIAQTQVLTHPHLSP